MAPPAGTLRVGPYFAALLGIFAVLYAIAFWPGERHTPRLGIDLVGGTQVIFTAKAPHGQTPTGGQMSQAKTIMEDRVNGTGVTEATVVIQGTDELVVSIPGATSTDVEKLGAAAVLNFRGLIAPSTQVTCGGTSAKGGFEFGVPPSSTVTIAAVQNAFAAAKYPLTAAPKSVKGTSKTYIVAQVPNTTTALTSAQQSAITTAVAKTLKIKSKDIQAAPLCATDPFAFVLDPASQTYDAGLAKLLTPCAGKVDPALTACLKQQPAGKAKAYGSGVFTATQLSTISALLPTFACDSAQDEADLANKYYLACDYGSQYGQNLAYLLGPVVVAGHEIDSADAQAPNASQGGGDWTVQLNLKGSGDSRWGAYTGSHNIAALGGKTSTPTYQCSASTVPCPDFVGFTLDGRVINAPVNETTISGLPTQISGNFSSKQAKDLANQLKYGALPLSFKAETAQHVSATLGTAQLRASFIAGGIGLVLVVLYSLIYYRALGVVTIASLAVSAGLTFACLVFLGRQIGFTLDLAGVAGFIVALGITADSFVVFFERLKDEVHGGRSVRVAVPRAWVRARRTILSADTVSFLAAAILYYFASADVKGFAFTLGLSTILDLVVVFLFTHPMLSMLSRLRAFGSARFTGLDALRGVPLPEPAVEPVRERAAARGAARLKKAPSAVAVLDGEDDDDQAEAGVADELTEQVTDDDDASRERRRTTPLAGSAAERAAARRARMRGKTEEGQH